MPIQSINPTTEEILETYTELTEEEVDAKLDVAHRAFEAWKLTSFDVRKERMLELARLLRSNKTNLAELITLEMGQPITQALAQVEKCAWVCEYYAENAERILAPATVKTDASESYIRFDPMGVVFAIMPWNYPLWQVFRFIAPAAMAGNVGLLKHASNVPACALAIEKLFEKADFPEGVFQTLLMSASKVEHVIQDARVAAVTLTGSEAAGKKVGAQAGESLKKSVLELGGSDAFIVLEDADVEEAAKVGATARLQNCGQSCVAAKRFILVESIAEKFLATFKTEFENIKVGDPMHEETQMGPLVSAGSLKEIESQVQAALDAGAELITGGNRLDRKGFFYAPTILTNITRDVPVYDQEVFGPVALVIIVQDEQEAIRVANDVPFGLGSSLWTTDKEKAKEIAAKLETGGVFINSLYKSDPRLPFGGVKKSGYGRELSEYGIKEFVNVKTVWVK